MISLLVFGGIGTFAYLVVWSWLKAASLDEQLSEAWRRGLVADEGFASASEWRQERDAMEAHERELLAWGEGIESFEYREPEDVHPILQAAIDDWKAQVSDPTPEQHEAMWQRIREKIQPPPMDTLRRHGKHHVC